MKRRYHQNRVNPPYRNHFPTMFHFSRLLLIPAVLLLLQFAQPTALAQEAGEKPVTTHLVTITTTLGSFTLELYGKDAPQTVKNFVGLCDSGFYNGLNVHRVHPGFLIQAGCPNTRDTVNQKTWGKGGSSIYGGPFRDELNTETPSYQRGYLRGTVAMANQGPHTNTSQFFILLKDVNEYLPKRFPIFGSVQSGMETVEAISEVHLVNITKMGGVPETPVTIESTLVTVIEEN